jgi:hypothetical protein
VSAIDNLLSRIPTAKAIGRDRWKARCPAHQDKTPSLYLRSTDDGRVLMHCFGGCEALDVLGALGLEMTDLFPERLPSDYQPPRRERLGVTGMDIVRVLRHELWALQIVASDFSNGVNNQETIERAFRISQRILTALDIVDGER